MLTLEITDDRSWFKPGELVEGRASWYLDEEPDAIEIRLFWHTSGKGTRDVGIVERRRVDRPGANGHRDFSLTVPEGPYSFSGRLITLEWGLELVVLPDAEAERIDLRVGPRPVEVVIR